MNMSMVLVYITTPDRETARSIGATLVRERLAACANIIGGMESFYWWGDKVESAIESICLCKTTGALFPALEKRAKELHPYEVPCIVSLPLTQGHGPFMRWIEEGTAKDPNPLS